MKLFSKKMQSQEREPLRRRLLKGLSVVGQAARKVGPQDRVSISIEGGAVKCLVTRGRRVLRWGSIALDPDLVKDGLIVDQEKVGAKVAELFRSQRVRPKKVVAGLSGLYSLPRAIDLPHMPRNLMREAITQEFRRSTPVSLEEMYLSWQAIRAKGQGSHIYALGVPKATMDAQVQTLRRIGVDPSIVDAKPLALARAVDSPDALIVDVQRDDFDIVLVMEGVPVISRSTLMPRTGRSLEASLGAVVQELVRTVEFYEKSSGGRSLDPSTPLFVTADMAIYPQLKAKIEKELGYPVATLKPPLHYPPHFPVDEYAVNIGLALKGLSAEGKGKNASPFRSVDLNLLPDVYSKPKEMHKGLLWAAGATVGLGLLFLLYQANMSAREGTSDLRAQVSEANQEVRLKAALTQQIGELQQAVEEAEAAGEAMERDHQALLEKRGPFSEHLQAVLDSVVPGVKISDVRQTEQEIRVNGQADDHSAALSYVSVLTGRFAKVDINSLGGGAGDIAFNLSLIKHSPPTAIP